MKKYSLLGYPLKHTLSPPIHQKLFELAGYSEDECTYDISEVKSEDLGEFYRKRLLHLDGYNITIPYKVEIISYIDKLDVTADKYKSVNCVKNTNGVAVGYNTDCTGFLRALSAGGGSLGGRVLQAGCGGAGRMTAIEAICAGSDLTICVRAGSEKSVQPVIEYRESHLDDELVNKSKISIVHIDEISGEFDLIVNSTSVGMYPNIDSSPLPDAVIEGAKVVFDIVYNPKMTKLLTKAEELGKVTIGGMAMLVWQAAVAHEIWDGSHYKDEDIAEIIGEMERLV